MENKFTQAMSKLTDDELVKIVTVQRFDYEPLAVEAAEEIIKVRNIDTSRFEDIISEVRSQREEQKRIDAEKAEGWQRFVNHLVDSAVYIVLYFSLLALPAGMFSYSETDTTTIAILLIAVVSYFPYLIIMEYKFQKTLGKFITKTKVVNINGDKPDLRTIVIRTLCRLIPFDRLSFLFFTEGFHDSFSKTKVIRG